jgi:hypothetical protein
MRRSKIKILGLPRELKQRPPLSARQTWKGDATALPAPSSWAARIGLSPGHVSARGLLPVQISLLVNKVPRAFGSRLGLKLYVTVPKLCAQVQHQKYEIPRPHQDSKFTHMYSVSLPDERHVNADRKPPQHIPPFALPGSRPVTTTNTRLCQREIYVAPFSPELYNPT